MEMKFKMYVFFNVMTVLSLCHAFDSESVLMLRRLEERVNELESKQTEDGKHIELLRQKCDRSPQLVTSESVDLQKLESSLDSLRADVAALASTKERESERTSDYHELRLELDSVHSDYGKLKVDLEGLKDRREEDLKVVSQQRNNQVTIKWLQKTSEDLRREIKELAAAHNVSAAIRQQQKSDNALSLLRSDVIDLRNKLEGVRVTQDRGAATLALMQQDITDLQNQRHQTAANYELFREEVSQLKDEFLLNLNSSTTPAASRSVEASPPLAAPNPLLPFAMDEGEPEEKVDEGATGATVQRAIKKKNKKFENNILESLFNVESNHRIRHRGRVIQSEVEELRVVVTALQSKQKRTEHKLNELRRNHTAVESHLQHIWGRMGDLLNASRWRAAQHSSVERAIESVREELKRVEENGVETSKTLHNLTDSVSGIDKLHTSTIQLFEALEGLEDEYSERIGDLHKEVSKFEFNMAQLSSTVNIMKEDQSNQFTALKTTRSDMSGIRQQVEDQNYRLASLRSQVLHDEANALLNKQRGDGLSNHLEHALGRDEDQTSLLLDLEARIAEFNARLLSQSRLVNDTVDGLRKKADLIHVVHWAESADRMDEKISNVSKLVDKTGTRVERLERQMKDMFQQLPTDCSEVVDTRTGSYQIHLPGAESSMSVLCDLESDGGGWTVVQNRAGSSVDFDRSWSDYSLGFGDVSFDGDFWIGNQALHRLSVSGAQLRIELWDQDDVFRYAQYENVRVEDEQHSYKLHVHGFQGNASDALSYHQAMKFSSRDEDHDYIDSINCAGQYGGGWWYRNCQHANLNGKYSLGLTWFDQNNNTWLQLKRVQIKIRPKNFK